MVDIPTQFTDSKNREIGIFQKWFECKSSWPYGIKSFGEFAKFMKIDEYPKNDGFALNKIISSNYIKALLNEYGFEPNSRAYMLDVCSGPAILPRMFKYHGIVGYADAVDISPRGDECSDERLLQLMGAIAPINMGQEVTPVHNKLLHINDGLVEVQNDLSYVLDFTFNDGDPNKMAMDNYYVSDFLELDVDRQYDLISLNAGMEYFDSSVFFKKVYNLLKPGGMLITFNDYFYHIFGSAMHLPMDSPWLHTRITKDDFYKYVETYRPDMLDSYRACYYFGSTHKTVLDFQADARGAGLETLGFRRKLQKVIFYEVYKSGWLPYVKSVVLPESQGLNPTVSIEDLFTHYALLVAKKPG